MSQKVGKKARAAARRSAARTAVARDTLDKVEDMEEYARAVGRATESAKYDLNEIEDDYVSLKQKMKDAKETHKRHMEESHARLLSARNALRASMPDGRKAALSLHIAALRERVEIAKAAEALKALRRKKRVKFSVLPPRQKAAAKAERDGLLPVSAMAFRRSRARRKYEYNVRFVKRIPVGIQLVKKSGRGWYVEKVDAEQLKKHGSYVRVRKGEKVVRIQTSAREVSISNDTELITIQKLMRIRPVTLTFVGKAAQPAAPIPRVDSDRFIRF